MGCSKRSEETSIGGNGNGGRHRVNGGRFEPSGGRRKRDASRIEGGGASSSADKRSRRGWWELDLNVKSSIYSSDLSLPADPRQTPSGGGLPAQLHRKRQRLDVLLRLHVDGRWNRAHLKRVHIYISTVCVCWLHRLCGVCWVGATEQRGCCFCGRAVVCM